MQPVRLAELRSRFDNPMKMLHIKQLLPCFFFLILMTGSVQLAEYPSKSSDMRLVVLSKGVAILPCDSRIENAPVVQYSWSKNNKPVVGANDARIQITEEGHLWVKDTNEDDSGIYVCNAVAGALTTEVNVTLIVLVPDEVPYFVNISSPDITIQRTTGSSVKLRCPAKGHPTPKITWYKDEELLSNESFIDRKIGKWSLLLKHLKTSDTGNYTCFAANNLGIINTTFPLQVMSKESHVTQAYNGTRPDLSVFHPLNTTVKYGSSATFQCRVRSEAPPNIQWLKKIEDSELAGVERDEHDIIKVQGENFRVLPSSEVVQRPDGSFLNKLTIAEVFEGDSGKYICLGANAMGYSFRSAYLTVLPRPRPLPLGWSRSVAAHPGHPSSLLVAIPISLGVLVGILVALVVVCHRRRTDTILPPIHSTPTCRKVEPRRASKTATTVLDNPREEAKQEEGPPKVVRVVGEEGVEGTSSSAGVLSEVELEGTGAVVTKLCQLPLDSYDGGFGVRNEV